MTEQDKRWVRGASLGEYRGEGEWTPFTGDEAEWVWLISTRYMPAWIGPEAPTDEQYLNDSGGRP